MSKKAILALTLAIALPMFGYLLLSYMSHRAIQMPGRYFYDSVIVNNDHGKTSFDTVWHQVKGISLENQLGQKVSLDDLKGKVVVVDFFFTHCPTICPEMTENMRRLQQSFTPSDSLVQFVSISIDPEHDDLSRLRWWGEKFGVSPNNWWLTTGNKDSIYKFALKEMKASVADVGIDTGFIHTQNFFLLDRNHIIRGWYDGLDSTDQHRLVKDIPLLMLERDQTRSFGQYLKDLLKQV